MRDYVVGRLFEKIKTLFNTEVATKLMRMKVDTSRDRLRIIFEFEFQGPRGIKDAVEIRHRRPWE